MKVSGFTFIKNAIKYDFPIQEAILSVLPLCDEFIVALGDSEDDTLRLINSIDSEKIKIVNTVWDETLLNNGEVLAVETNKAKAAIDPASDWCIYIQGDEVLHEADYAAINLAMIENVNEEQVDGLLFKYKHFYGSFDYIANSSNWYKNEIRIIKNNSEIYSYRDAQGFRIGQNKKLKVKSIPATVFHYGWVKKPETMQEKRNRDFEYRHGIQAELKVEKNVAFDYSKIDVLEKFNDKHPSVMQERIDKQNWKFDYDISKNNLSIKEKLKRITRKIFGKEIGEYRNYELIK